ncbi:MAG: tRNA(Ile)(2)-agmatinylcytidine synthase [Thermoprotei archaeon]
MVIVHIGVDDTDSVNGGCTTYVAAVTVKELLLRGVRFIDYPNLIRLNPNVPWKTRGNGAIAFRLLVDDDVSDVFDIVYNVLLKYYDKYDEKPQPVLAMYVGDVIEEFRAFSKNALSKIISLDDALRLARKFNVYYKDVGRGLRGLIGALAAIGEPLDHGDYTYELLVYRSFFERSLRRNVDEKSVFEMDEKTYPYTFNNIDRKDGRVLLTPHGPDPVILGIRGDDPSLLVKALNMIRIYDKIERWVIFRSNQGTDAHLINAKLSNVSPYMSVIVNGIVWSKPIIIPGGHVFFMLNDSTGVINVAVYKETGDLNIFARKLLPGDVISVAGGIKPGPNGLNLNAERITVIKAIERKIKRNPRCPICNVSMSSMGYNQGYRCKKCGYISKESPTIITITDQDLEPNKVHLQSPKARRHLTKPLERYGREKQFFEYGILHEPWHWP